MFKISRSICRGRTCTFFDNTNNRRMLTKNFTGFMYHMMEFVSKVKSRTESRNSLW